MSTKHRKSADTVANQPLPRLPQPVPKDWPPGLYEILRDILRALEQRNDIVFGIQNNGTKMPLRAWLNFTGGATVTDSEVNDRTDVSVP